MDSRQIAVRLLQADGMGRGQLVRLVTCVSRFETMMQLAERKGIEGVYYVCGRHPWLYVQTVSTESLTAKGALTSPFDLRAIRPGASNWASVLRTWKTAEKRMGPFNAGNSVLAHILLRPFIDATGQSPDRRQSQSALVKWLGQCALDVIPRRLLVVHDSDWWFALECRCKGMRDLSALLDAVARQGFDTATKCALVVWRDRNKTNSHPKKLADDLVPDSHFRAATIVRNDRFFFEKPIGGQVDSLTTALSREPLPANSLDSKLPPIQIGSQLRFDLDGFYVEKNDLNHPNHYVDRFSLRPVSRFWSMNFVFVTASKEQSGIRESVKQLVCVDLKLVIPRVYQITGEFDFLIPAYTLGPEGRQLLRSRIAGLKTEQSPQILRCRIPGARSESKDSLSEPEARAALALFRNSIAVQEFWQDLSVIRDHWRDKMSRADVDAVLRRRVSPRALSVHRSVRNREYQNLPTKIADLGMSLTWEFDSDLIERALVRLWASEKESVDPHSYETQVMETVQEAMRDSEVAFDWFLGDRPEVIGIARYSRREQLACFLGKLQEHFERVEFHMILDKLSSIPNLKPEVICKPCTFPVDPSTLEPKDHDCSHCSRYLKRPADAHPLKIRTNLRSDESLEQLAKSMRAVTFGLVDLEIAKERIPDLGSVPRPGPTGAIEPSWQVDGIARANALELGRILAKAIIAGPLRDAQVVVLPEYCVSADAVRVILGKLRLIKSRRQRLLVLGTHLDGQGANVAPIVHLGPEGMRVYTQHKTDLSPIEIDLGLVRELGTGLHVFRTDFGNFIVPICVDAYSTYQGWYADADAVLIPSFHPGREDQNLPKLIADSPAYQHRVCVFANGAASSSDERARAESKIFVPKDAKICDEHVTMLSFGKVCGSGKIKTMTLDLLALDRLRARDRLGRPPAGVIPIHCDAWPNEADSKGPGVQRALGELGNVVGVPKASPRLERYLTLDWKHAHEFWAAQHEGAVDRQ